MLRIAARHVLRGHFIPSRGFAHTVKCTILKQVNTKLSLGILAYMV